MGRWPIDVPGVVALPDGRRVRGTGLRRGRGEAPPPDLAVYLTARDPRVGSWPHEWIRWPDFRLPTDSRRAVEVLAGAHARARDERVEIACGGGVGRTGTALALLAVMSGLAPADALRWVRESYHPRAVETPWQRRWVARVVADHRLGEA